MKLVLSTVSWFALALGACATTKPVAPTQPTPGTTTAAADEFEFPVAPPQVGDMVTELKERTMVATVEVSASQRMHLMSSEQRTELKQIVALDGDIVTKLKVTHRSVTTQETVNGKPRTEPTPTVGKTYLVWRAGGELQVSYLDGTAPPAAETKEVRRGNRSVGRPEPLERIVAARVWKVDQRFEFTAAQVAEMNQAIDADEPSLTSMALTLQRVDDAVATMAMTMTMTEADAGMAVELAGTLKLDRKTGRPLEFSGAGPFSAVAALKMVGTMSMKVRYAY